MNVISAENVADISSIYAELDRKKKKNKKIKGNLCSIYEDRPLFCRIDDCYEQFFKEKYTLDEFYKLNYEICNKLKNKELCF